MCDSDYDACTDLDWAEYEFATIEYDHRLSPDAARAIRAIFKRYINDKPGDGRNKRL